MALRRAKPKANLGVKFGAFVVGSCLVLGFLAGNSGIPNTVPTTQYMVRGGETIWSIASHIKPWPTDEVRDWIDSHNQISGDGIIQPGQVLTVPVSGG